MWILLWPMVESSLFNFQTFEHFLNTLFLFILNLIFLWSKNVLRLLLGLSIWSILVYFPGQSSYSLSVLMHSLALCQELNKDPSPAYPSPQPHPIHTHSHRILDTFFVPLFSLVFCPADSIQFAYFELWFTPPNLHRTTVLCWTPTRWTVLGNWEMPLCKDQVSSGAHFVSFPYLRNHSGKLFVDQCLKIVALCILFGFII